VVPPAKARHRRTTTHIFAGWQRPPTPQRSFVRGDPASIDEALLKDFVREQPCRQCIVAVCDSRESARRLTAGARVNIDLDGLRRERERGLTLFLP
jgi:hypothetical protein